MDNAANAILASPFTLLEEAASSTHESEDVLLLSFNVNLSFFERFALATARVTRGRVTVVGDVSATTSDLRTRYAGNSYLSGYAEVSGGLFHPKLVVIVGKSRATVAIGSANVSLDGWHDNAELWTVLRADEDRCPTTINSVADWLRSLPGLVQMSDLVADSLVRVGTELSSFRSTEPGPRFVSTSEGPILSQLPEGPVDELVVTAPFHDTDAAGLEAILDRLRPAKWEVLLQPRLGVYDGTRIAAVVDERGGRSRVIASDRYHHGKLLEWAIGDQRWALTGSPNVSTAALLRSLGNHANCEIGLVAEIDSSLRPEARDADSSEITDHPYKPIVFSARPRVALLGAVIEGACVRLHLARPLTGQAELEMRDQQAEWHFVATVEPGARDPLVPAAIGSGQAVRLSLAEETFSNIAHVTDPIHVLRRLRSGVQTSIRGQVPQLLADEGLLGELMTAFTQLREQVVDVQGHGQTHAGARSIKTVPSKEAAMSAEEWLYYDSYAARAGDSLVAFGLGLPRIGSIRSGQVPEDDDEFEADTFEVSDDDGQGSQGETAEDALDEDEESVVDFSQRTEALRRRFRRWCDDLVAQLDGLVLLGRTAALRVLLYALAGRLWPHESEEWVRLLSRATASVGRGDGYPRERSQAASVCAVALAALRTGIRLSDRGHLHRLYHEAARSVEELLQEVDEDAISREVHALGSHLGITSWSVDDVVEAVLRRDPVSDAIEALSERGIDAEVVGLRIHLEGTVSDPVVHVLRAVRLASDAKAVAVSAYGAKGWALAVWCEPSLLLVSQVPRARRWQIYRFASGAKDLHAIVGETGRIPSRYEFHNSYGSTVPPDAVAILEAVALAGDALGDW